MKETGDAAIDELIGRQLAHQFFRYGKEEGDCLGGVFASVINGMIAKGPDYCSHVRGGFLAEFRSLIPAGYRFDGDRIVFLEH